MHQFSDPWISIFTRGGVSPRFRLFCFPFAGGGAAFYRTWPNGLPDGVEVFSIRPPGRETRLRERPYLRLDSLAEAAADALLPYLDLPFAFFGHSMGGLLAYEVACHFRSRAITLPAHLFISGYRAPHRPAHHPPVHQADTSVILRRLRNLNGTPAAFFDNEELIEMMLPGIRADFSVLETYTSRPREPLERPLSVFGGYHDSEATGADIMAWQGYTRDRFNPRMIAGGHFFIVTHQSEVLKAISEDLSFHIANPASRENNN